MTDMIQVPEDVTHYVGPTRQVHKTKVIPTYALLPYTELLDGNMGYLCTGWDAFAPRFIMTEKFEEMLCFIRQGRKVRITIPNECSMVEDLMIHVNAATQYVASKSKQTPHLYLYSWDAIVGNFRMTQAI